MAILCTWCGTEHEAGAGNFCSDDCHQKFSTACQLWGEGAYGAGEVSIWQLHTALGRHECRAQVDPAQEGSEAPYTGAHTDGVLSGTATQSRGSR